jgi:hypothetical protein
MTAFFDAHAAREKNVQSHAEWEDAKARNDQSAAAADPDDMVCEEELIYAFSRGFLSV